MGNVWVPWLADAARLTGYGVVEVAGWRGRGHGGFRAVETVVLHHTADGPGEYPSLRVVRDGRSDLPGPLCNFGLGRSGTIYVVAAGVAWHAGASTWAGFSDLNDESIGIEAESAGTRDDWTAAQRDAYPRLVAACLYYLRRGAERAAGHKEVCLPRGRKIDPAFYDMNALRARVSYLLADPLARIPRSGGAAPGTVPPASRKDEPLAPMNIEYGDDLTFRSAAVCESGGAAAVGAKAWVLFAATWGKATFVVTALDHTRKVLLRETFSAENNSFGAYELPQGSRIVTIEGTTEHGRVIPTASIITKTL